MPQTMIRFHLRRGLSRNGKNRGERGFSLVEVIVATLLLATMSVGLLSTMVQASRLARINGNAMAAKNIAQGYLERMALDDFANIGPAKYHDIAEDDDPPVWLDQAANIRCAVQFRFNGYGIFDVTNNSKQNLTCSDIHWNDSEFDGDWVYIIDGPAAGQFAQVSKTTPNTLHLANPGLSTAPQGSRFMVNNGKTVEITTIWHFCGREYKQTVRSLVINARNSGNLGF